jgi:CheY-like chemotaxis protein
MNEPNRFETLIQDALDHLFDPAYLLTHQLTAALVGVATSEPPGQRLHRVLREGIDRLKPSPDAPLHSPSWRSYHCLSLRYVEMLTMSQVARELGVSPRQCRRDHHEALTSLAAVLRSSFQVTEDVHAPELPSPPSGSPENVRNGDLLEAEVGKIGTTAAVAASDLGSVVNGVAATLAALAARKGISFRIALPPSAQSVVVDRTVLRQLLLELLLFALDRSTGSHVEVRVAGNDDFAELTVKARSSDGRAARTDGGNAPDDTRLTICRQLADLQGLTLVVEEREDALSASLLLPSDLAPVVLVIDDNADVIRLFRRYLDGLYEVVEASTGEQALNLARNVRPRVITLDVMMPSQDGWEILQSIKHDPAIDDIPVIVCSVLRERELALSLGAADYLAKPVTGHQLVSAIHRCRLAS